MQMMVFWVIVTWKHVENIKKKDEWPFFKAWESSFIAPTSISLYVLTYSDQPSILKV